MQRSLRKPPHPARISSSDRTRLSRSGPTAMTNSSSAPVADDGAGLHAGQLRI
ncbi:MAG: hypothetical protein ACKOEY_05420 [Phenylobacterium sp.]